MEIRNCEEYVLNELLTLQDKFDKLQKENAKLSNELNLISNDLYKLEAIVDSCIDVENSDKTAIRFKPVLNTDDSYLTLISYFPKVWL